MAISWAELGQASDSAAGTTLALTVPVGGVAQGKRVVVAFAMPKQAGTISCADSRANTYSTDADISGAAGCRVVVLSAPVTTALQQNDTITVTSPSDADRVLAVLIGAGLTDGGQRDQFATDTNSTEAVEIGPITTTVADEAIFTAVAARASAFSFTEGAGWTQGTSVISNETNLFPLYRVVAATGTYNGTGTMSTGLEWEGGIVSYQSVVAQTLTPDPVAYSWVVNAATVTLRPRMIALRRFWRGRS